MGLPATPYLPVVEGSRDRIFKFWEPLHISERLELETSNLTCRLIARVTNKNAKLGQRGRTESRDLLLQL